LFHEYQFSPARFFHAIEFYKTSLLRENIYVVANLCTFKTETTVNLVNKNFYKNWNFTPVNNAFHSTFLGHNT